MKDVIYLDWEYHPAYGTCSRLVFVKKSKDTYEVKREYR